MPHINTRGLIQYEIFGGTAPEITEWEVVLRELKLHAVLPIIGIRKNQLLLPETVKREVQTAIFQQVSNYTRVASAQQKIIDGLKKDSIFPIVIKGMSAAQCYPNPSLRTMGDIDLLLEKEDEFNKTVKALQEIGYSSIRQYDALTYGE